MAEPRGRQPDVEHKVAVFVSVGTNDGVMEFHDPIQAEWEYATLIFRPAWAGIRRNRQVVRKGCCAWTSEPGLPESYGKSGVCSRVVSRLPRRIDGIGGTGEPAPGHNAG